jgi:hypothetical protein
MIGRDNIHSQTTQHTNLKKGQTQKEALLKGQQLDLKSEERVQNTH